MDKLGMHLQSGQGVEQDLKHAFEMFQRSAALQHVAAQFHLANCYENGLGCDLDVAEATAWYERAALAGCRTSHERLRRLLMRACLDSAGGSGNDEDSPLGEGAYYFTYTNGYCAPAA
jgi:TPR repeat protein